MSNMKCPICGKDMVFIESDEGFDVFVCTNSKCQCSGYANESVWKYIERTRKALDLAKDTLHWYNDNYDSVVARNTLDEITTLEQKDVK